MEPAVLETVSGKLRLRRRGRGQALIVLHRDTGTHGWTEFHDHLSSRYDVIVPSLPGFDGSDLPDWVRDPFHMAALVGQIIDRLDVTLPCPVIGLGFGGWIAASLATMGQDRISGLVLLAPMGLKPDQGEILDQFLINAIDYVRIGFHEPQKFDQIYTARPDIEALRRWDQNRETMTRIAWKPIGHDPQLPALLRAVGIPSLLIWGKDDKVVPVSCAQHWLRCLGHARLIKMDGNHMLDLEHPAELTTAVSDFITSCAA